MSPTSAPSWVTPNNLAILKSPALKLPRVRRHRDFERFLDVTHDGLFGCLDGLDGRLAGLISPRLERMRTLASSSVEAWTRGRTGDVDGALACLEAGLSAVQEELVSMSRRHSSVLPGQCWYRLAAWEGVSTREHMFHAPFSSPQHDYRFSTLGAPSLYLANSVYLCWLECGRPSFGRSFVSRFEVDTTGFELLDIPASSATYVLPLDLPDLPGVDFHPRQLMNSPYRNDVTAELADYLTVWPLLAAATVRRRQTAEREDRPPEYTIPQLLMLWVRQSDRFLGIRYFTSKSDISTGSNDWPINLSLPTRTRGRTSGYCDFLAARTRWTAPQSLAAMRRRSPRDLATPAAARERERRSGRVMLQRGNSIRPYFETAFGKMEYWLDRPEQELSTVTTRAR